MDKKHNYTNHGKSSKRLWITFLFFCIITTGFMQAANKVFAQATVTASFKNATLSENSLGNPKTNRLYFCIQHQ